MFRCARAAALTHTRSYGTRVACAPAPRVAAMSSSSSLLVSQRSAIALPLAVSCRRSLATASAASVADLSAVTAWRAGKALVDLRSILDSERATSQGAAYERRMEEYVLYDDAPTAVLSFWFANKPLTVARSALQYNALMLSKANAREFSVDDVLATKSRMKADGVAADEATYEVLFRALTRARRGKDAAAAFDEMVALGLMPRVTHYQQLIVLLALTDDLAGAEAWAARLLKDKDGVLPSRDALEALVAAYRRAPAADAKKHEAKLAAGVKRLDELVAAETADAIAGEPRGVQWKMKFKAVTSTGGDDKGKADAKPAAAPAAAKKK